IMTTTVITVSLDTTVSEIAKMLLVNNFGAVPVVDNGNVAGIVSETDFLRRPETGTVKRRSWLAYFEAPNTLAEEYVRLHGTRARDVMSKKIRSVASDADLLEIVDLMEREAIRRVLVIDDGKLRGIVCRSDLLRGMLASRSKAKTSEEDQAIRAMLLKELEAQPWRSIAGNKIIVVNGAVSFWGVSGSDAERKALRVAAESIPGVTRVEDRTIGPEL
ncbi:MAG: CBS domain-containing protein, partial [Nitrospiraceae bacterium]